MNAAGGLAVTDYKNCHMRPSPYTFECLGDGAGDSVLRLVEAMFENDVEELKPGGKLRKVLMTAGAAIVASYNNLVSDTRDVQSDNLIVQQIRVAAHKAKIDDSNVQIIPNDPRRWLTVLRSWSDRIKTHFQSSNVQAPLPDAPVEKQLSSMIGIVKSLLTTVQEMKTDLKEVKQQCSLQTENGNLMLHQLELQSRKMEAQDKEIVALKSDKRRLEQMVYASQYQTPITSGQW